jgi:hypothetical protein
VDDRAMLPNKHRVKNNHEQDDPKPALDAINTNATDIYDRAQIVGFSFEANEGQ